MVRGISEIIVLYKLVFTQTNKSEPKVSTLGLDGDLQAQTSQDGNVRVRFSNKLEASIPTMRDDAEKESLQVVNRSGFSKQQTMCPHTFRQATQCERAAEAVLQRGAGSFVNK